MHANIVDRINSNAINTEEKASSLKDISVAYLGISGLLVALASAGTGTALQIFAVILAIIWPSDDGIDISTGISRDILKYINDSLNNEVLNAAQTDINIIKEVIMEFSEINKLAADQGGNTYDLLLTDYYVSTEVSIANSVKKMINSERSDILLPKFLLAASLHLAFLRLGYVLNKKYPGNSTFFKKTSISRFRYFNDHYSRHCLSTYMKLKNHIITKEAYYPSRKTTINLLDISTIRLLPFFTLMDPEYYPENTKFYPRVSCTPLYHCLDVNDGKGFLFGYVDGNEFDNHHTLNEMPDRITDMQLTESLRRSTHKRNISSYLFTSFQLTKKDGNGYNIEYTKKKQGATDEVLGEPRLVDFTKPIEKIALSWVAGSSSGFNTIIQKSSLYGFFHRIQFYPNHLSDDGKINVEVTRTPQSSMSWLNHASYSVVPDKVNFPTGLNFEPFVLMDFQFIIHQNSPQGILMGWLDREILAPLPKKIDGVNLIQFPAIKMYDKKINSAEFAPAFIDGRIILLKEGNRIKFNLPAHDNYLTKNWGLRLRYSSSTQCTVQVKENASWGGGGVYYVTLPPNVKPEQEQNILPSNYSFSDLVNLSLVNVSNGRAIEFEIVMAYDGELRLDRIELVSSDLMSM